jgi:hypothetical protein
VYPPPVKFPGVFEGSLEQPAGLKLQPQQVVDSLEEFLVWVKGQTAAWDVGVPFSTSDDVHDDTSGGGAGSGACCDAVTHHQDVPPPPISSSSHAVMGIAVQLAHHCSAHRVQSGSFRRDADPKNEQNVFKDYRVISLSNVVSRSRKFYAGNLLSFLSVANVCDAKPYSHGPF